MVTIIFLLVSMSFTADQGTMSWYGDEEFEGRLTACGETYRSSYISVAHKTMPIGTVVIFWYKNRMLLAIVNDRGPYIAGREWDASKRLFKLLIREDFHKGVVEVNYIIVGRYLRDTMRYNLN